MSMEVRRTEAPGAQAAHHPDAHWVAVDGGTTVARCSLWWRQAPPLEGERTAAVGHFSASPGAAHAARALLEQGCRELQAQGATLAVGPMDGNTWRSYRLVSDAGQEPPFFLEPWNPPEWNAHFTAAGFAPLAGFHSSVTTDLAAVDERIPEAAARLRAGGVTLRDRKSTRLNSSHVTTSRMPSSA